MNKEEYQSVYSLNLSVIFNYGNNYSILIYMHIMLNSLIWQQKNKYHAFNKQTDREVMFLEFYS